MTGDLKEKAQGVGSSTLLGPLPVPETPQEHSQIVSFSSLAKVLLRSFPMRLQASVSESTVGESRRGPPPPSAPAQPIPALKARPAKAASSSDTASAHSTPLNSLGHEGEFTALPDSMESWLVCLYPILKSNVKR